MLMMKRDTIKRSNNMPKIDKVYPFYTDKEITRLEELDKEQEILREKIRTQEVTTKEGARKANALAEQHNKIDYEGYEIYAHALNRYIDTFEDNPLRVYDDIREVAGAVTQDDFRQMLSIRRTYFAEIDTLDEGAREILGEDFKTRLYKGTLENYNNFFLLLKVSIKDQLAVIEEYELGDEEVDKILDEITLRYYPNDHPEDFEDSELAVTFIKPKQHIFNLTKAGRKLFSNDVSAQQLKQVSFDISPTRGRRSKPALYMVNVDLDGISTQDNLTEFDGGVFNSVISVIAENAVPVFTAKQIAQHYYYGDNPNNSNPSAQQVGAVTKSLEKMRKVDIKIDYTDHMRLNGKLTDEEGFEVEDYFLPSRKHHITTGGNTITAYEVMRTPPLQRYAEDVNQISRVPASALNVPVNLDEGKAVVRDYVLREISIKKRDVLVITTDKILEVAGLSPDTVTRKKRKSIMDALDKMLAHWKADKTIKDYSYTRHNKSVTRVNIIRA